MTRIMQSRRGETVYGIVSIEIIISGGEAYIERVLEFEFEVTEPACAGYFDPISGAAEPPSGPELDVRRLCFVETIGFGNNKTESREYLSTNETAFLKRFLGEAVYEKAFDYAYERAAETL